MRAFRKAAVVFCVVMAAAFLLLCAGSVMAGDMSRTSRYFKDASGNPLFLVGYYGWASVAPGYYIDHPAQYANMINEGQPYKINYIRISLGINRMTSSTNPQSWDGRPTPVPFLYVNNKADLDQWDPTFWDGLRYHCDLARQKGVFVHVAFFDGVDIRGGSEAYRWPGSFWNINNQTRSFFGNLDSNGDGNVDQNGEFYRLNDFNNNTGVGHYQRRLIDKAIAETNEYDNVFYEVGNELLGAPSDWYSAVTNYIKARTNKPVTQNGGSRSSNTDGWADHSGNDPAAIKSKVAAGVGQGYPWWDDPDGSSLCNGSADNLRRAAWYSFAGGAAAWGGFTVDFWAGFGGFNTTKATYYKNLMLFVEGSGVKFWNMVPSHSLVSSNSVNSCIANSGSEYVAYILNNSSATLNLSAVSGTAYYKLYDPRTGAWSSEQTVAGGGTRSFDRPSGAEDWVIHVYLTPDTQAPSVPTNVSASAQSHASISVSWTASTDNIGVAGYRVYRNGTMVGTSATTSYLDTGLSPSTTYSYTVSAFDASNNSSAQSSPAAVATTQAAPDYCSIDLGSSNVNNLLSHPQNSDGDTTSAVAGGLECRKPVNTGDQYYYFAIDDSFLYDEAGTTRYLEICYFDDQSTSVFMQPQYDSTGGAYTAAANVNFTNTGKWKTATWTLTNCKFANRQNAGADFRIYVGAYSVKIDSVRVSKIPWSNYNSAERSLGASEVYRGISHPQPSDGTTTPATIGGRDCRKTTGTGSYLYFNVSDAIIYNGNPSTVYLKVDYYDSASGSITPQYDSTSGAYTSSTPVALTGTNTWKSATWTLTDARFANNQNESSDFRLGVGSDHSVHIGKVLVSKVPFSGDTTPPSVPTGVSATTQSSTSIQVTWTASTDNVGVSGYNIFRNGSLAGTSGTTSFTDSGLTPGTTYSYTVSAYDAAGNHSELSSPPAVATTETIVDNDPPSVPTGVSATAQSSISIQVNWTASTDNVGVTGYKIFRNGSEVGTSGTPSYTDSGLTPSTTYSYTVSAYDAAGNHSAQSSPPAAATTYAYSDSLVGWWKMDETSGNNVLDSSGNGNHGTLVNPDRAMWTVGQYGNNPAGALSFSPGTDAGLNAYVDVSNSGTQFAAGNSFTVAAWIKPNFGEGYYQCVISQGQVNDQTNGWALKRRGGTSTEMAFRVGATRLTSDTGLTAGTWYHISGTYDATTKQVKMYIHRADRTLWIQKTATAGTFITNSGNLSIGRLNPQPWTYDWGAADPHKDKQGFWNGTMDDVRFYNYALSISEVQALLLPPDTQAPSVPTSVQAMAQSSTSIQVTWTASTDNVGVTGYKIFRDGSLAGTSSTTSFTDSGLTPGTTYSYTVSAYDAAGNNSAQSSPPAVATTETIVDNDPPSVPTDVTATAQSSSSIQITWTASTDNVGVTGYKIFRNGSEVGTSGTTSYTDSGLTPSTTYSYTVSAYDAAGNNSAQSSPPATAMTHAAGVIYSADDFENAALGPLYHQTSGIGWANGNMNSWNAVAPGDTRNVSDVVEGKHVQWAGLDSIELSRNFNEAVWSGPTIYVELDYTVQSTITEDNNVYVSKVGGNSVHFEFMSNGNIRERGGGTVLGKWDGTDARPELNLKTGWKRIKVTIDLPGQKYNLNIGGVDVGTNLPFRTAASDLDHIRFYRAKTGAADFSKGFIGIDNVYISTTPPGDMQPPSVPTSVVATAQSSSSIKVTWTASTDNVAVTGYKVFRNGSEVGTSVSTSYTDIGLAAGTSYSYTVSAYDAASNNSAQSSPAASAVTGVEVGIASAKELGDDVTVWLTGKVVTAVFADCIYIEETDRYAGIRVAASEVPVGLAVGDKVSVCGVLQTIAGERRIGGAIVVVTGTGNVDPLAMNNASVGGGNWNYSSATGAGQKGIAGATGANNIGLLITTWGNYMQVDSSTFTVDDGSGTPITCVIPAGVTLNPSWQYVTVTGISSCEQNGDDLYRKLLVRRQEDVISIP